MHRFKFKLSIAVVKKKFRYSYFFLLQPLIPALCISEHIFEKRYKQIYGVTSWILMVTVSSVAKNKR